jgi:hypothetical protein
MLAGARDTGFPDSCLEMVFDCLEGTLSPAHLVAFAVAEGNSTRLCEAYYYAGEATLLAGSADDAREWFQKCVDTGMKYDPGNHLDTMSEYELASLRLDRLRAYNELPASKQDL